MRKHRFFLNYKALLVPIAIFLIAFFVIGASAQEAAPAPAEEPPATVDEPASLPEAVEPETKESLPAEETVKPEEIVLEGEKEFQKVIEEQLEEQEKPEEVKIDEEVKAEDLDIKEAPKILPDSPLYGFKKLGRKISLTFTFDPAKKVEKQLDYANKKLIEAKALIEKEGAENAGDAIEKVAEDFQKDMEKIADKAEKLKELKKDQAPKIEKFIEKLTDHQFKQQKILEKIEEKASDKAFIKIKEAKEKALEYFGETIATTEENPEKIKENIENVMEKQKGSEFKNFKNLEVLKGLEEKVPEQAREAIKQAQSNALKRLRDSFTEEKSKRFKEYVFHASGDMTRRLEVLDDFRNEVDPRFIKDIDLIKDKTIGRFEERFDKFEDMEARDKFMEHLRDGDLGDFRIIKQIEEKVGGKFEEEMKKTDIEAAERFKEKFKNDPNAVKTAEMFKKFKENPDVVDFEVIKRLEEGLTPEQKAFIEGVKNEAAINMEEKFRVEGADFMERFVGTDPRSIEVLNELKDEVPESARFGIERALDAQVHKISDHMMRMDDPKMFERMKEQIKMKNEIKKEIEERESAFFEEMDEMHRRIEEQEKKMIEEKIQKLEELKQKFLEEGAKEAPPALQARIEKTKERFEEDQKQREKIKIKQEEIREKIKRVRTECFDTCLAEGRSEVDCDLECEQKEESIIMESEEEHLMGCIEPCLLGGRSSNECEEHCLSEVRRSRPPHAGGEGGLPGPPDFIVPMDEFGPSMNEFGPSERMMGPDEFNSGESQFGPPRGERGLPTSIEGACGTLEGCKKYCLTHKEVEECNPFFKEEKPAQEEFPVFEQRREQGVFNRMKNFFKPESSKEMVEPPKYERSPAIPAPFEPKPIIEKHEQPPEREYVQPEEVFVKPGEFLRQEKFLTPQPREIFPSKEEILPPAEEFRFEETFPKPFESPSFGEPIFGEKLFWHPIYRIASLFF